MTNDHTRNAGVQTVERYCKVTHKQSTLQSVVSFVFTSYMTTPGRKQLQRCVSYVLSAYHVKASESVPITKRLFVSSSVPM